MLYVLRNYLWILNEEELVESDEVWPQNTHTSQLCSSVTVVDLCSLVVGSFGPSQGVERFRGSVIFKGAMFPPPFKLQFFLNCFVLKMFTFCLISYLRPLYHCVLGGSGRAEALWFQPRGIPAARKHVCLCRGGLRPRCCLLTWDMMAISPLF